MKKKMCFLLLVMVLAGTVVSEDKSEVLHNYTDTLSYVLGRDVGSQLQEFGRDFNIDLFTMAVTQVLTGKESLLESKQRDSVRQVFAEQIKELEEKELETISERLREESVIYMSQNRRRRGVRATASGLQYIVLSHSEGKQPGPQDTVRAIYIGMLTDKTVIDRSLPDLAYIIDLDKTIPGLSEGIQMMSPGSSYRFFIPPDLAYGSNGIPPEVPPYSVIIFEVELVEILD
ncbi:FKBP-type peptidyl-prolyl cis-trans isomerase N-terminal domain-containing protein [Chitinispirillales bacterium ANBcel5]|uniref:FKBP-type peptidyl-prolyl cis-trans isomerase n=1 Tax=Cellulosispirillum alkaliphilum TaxID=3039283 RepID=UPI002A57DC69|nr:FKBP-type peptidyl-prolyl cis-trans isomerase N-terminal domain-containing protein [Chitinispirillales bacterium ANBcel5]